MKIYQNYFGEESDVDQCCVVKVDRRRTETHFNKLSAMKRTRIKRGIFKFQYSRNSSSTEYYTLTV